MTNYKLLASSPEAMAEFVWQYAYSTLRNCGMSKKELAAFTVLKISSIATLMKIFEQESELGKEAAE